MLKLVVSRGCSFQILFREAETPVLEDTTEKLDGFFTHWLVRVK